ncbi:MAG: sulfatase [Candidatus Binatia bacterium]
MSEPPAVASTSPSPPACTILLIATWSGLVTGLVEGVAFLIFQNFGGLIDVPPEILSVTPLFDVLLFGGLGLTLVGVCRVSPRGGVQVAVCVCAFVAFVDWLAIGVSSRMHYAALVLLAAGLAVQLSRWVRAHESAVLRFWRLSMPWAAALAVLAGVAVQGGRWLRERNETTSLPAALPGAPNVVVIVVDTLRADHLSSYGYARATSPNLDRIAREGVVFENACSTSSYTLPSHASLLTGRYPYEHGVGWAAPRALFHSRYPTLGEVLRSRGYRTAAFSANLFWFTRSEGFGRGFIHFDDYFGSVADMAGRTLYGRAADKLVLPRLGFDDILGRKRAADVNRAALRWIGRDADTPFFVFLNYLDTHDPYLPPQPYRRKFSRWQKPGGVLNVHRGRGHPRLTRDQLQGEIDAYDGAIAYVDDQIAQLLAALQERGLADNTLLVITSDHGEAFGEHGMLLHDNSLYREVIHVPLVFRWPGHLPAGVRVGQPVTNAALPVTVMDVLGDSDSTFPGPSLRQLWDAPAMHRDWPYPLAEMAYEPWAQKTFPVSQGSIQSLVTPRWHYIRHRTLGVELYDWQSDPLEGHNLAASASLKTVVTELGGRLAAVPWPAAAPRSARQPISSRIARAR